MNMRSAVLLCALIGSIGAPAAEAGIVLTNVVLTAHGQGYFQQYGALDRSEVPGTLIDDFRLMGDPSPIIQTQQITSVSSATRTFSTSITGEGSTYLRLSSNL